MSEQRYGVLIASSEYQDQKLENLRFPGNDVDGLNEVLSSKDYGNFAEVLVLKNRPHHEVLLKINQILKKAKKDDLVLIYYSGHGKLNAAGKLHLATADTIVDSLEATSLPIDSIKSYIDVSNANKFVLILDSCFSGAAGHAFTKGGVDDQLQMASGGRGTFIMTASTGIQVASEKEGDSFGVFTKHIIEGIRSGNAADDNGHVTIDSLYNYVHDHVLKESSQEPMKWNLNVRGDLVIADAGKSKRSERAKEIRTMLLDLASKNLLPDNVLSSSLKIIKLKSEQLNQLDRQHDELIDKLYKKEIELNCFIEDWVNVEIEEPAVAPEKEPTKKKQDNKNHTSFSFGKFWTQEKFNVITSVYLIETWLQLLIVLMYINNNSFLPPDWFDYYMLLTPGLGLVVAAVGYRIGLYRGIYLGLLGAILLPIAIIIIGLHIIDAAAIVIYFWTLPLAVISTILFWQMWISESRSKQPMIASIIEKFRK